MRLNKYIALATGLSRRNADEAIDKGRVTVNGTQPVLGQAIGSDDKVALDGVIITPPQDHQTIMLNKPRGYVCSRDGQGSMTIYELLPNDLHHLKPIGRLDKDSSGLLLLTNDGTLAHQLTHPSFEKEKQYQVSLNKPLANTDEKHITIDGVLLDDGISKLGLTQNGSRTDWTITMHEGRNRQIRRTFAKLGYDVINLHRVTFGENTLGTLKTGDWRII